MLRGEFGRFALFAGLVACCKEEIPAVVMLMGLYVWVVGRDRRGAWLAAGAAAWFLVANLLIIPAFSPLGENIHYDRYAELGGGLSEMVRTALSDPGWVWQVASEPAKINYLIKLLFPVGYLPLVLGVILGVVLFSPALFSTASATPAYPTDRPVWENPRYSQDGRIPIFQDNTPLGLPLYVIMGYGGLATYPDIVNMVPLLLTLMFMFATMGLRELRFPRKAFLLLLGSLSAWGLCWILALVFHDFLLRYPFKYTSAALPLVLLIAVAYNAESFSQAVARLWISSKGRGGLLLAVLGSIVIVTTALDFFPFLYYNVTIRIIGIGLGGILYILGINQVARLRLRTQADTTDAPFIPGRASWMALGVMSLLLILNYGLRMRSLPAVAGVEARDLYQFALTLPKDVLLAGDPFQMSNIPPFSRRSVLFSEEIMGVGDDRILDFYNAYYAESSESVVSFCQKYDVDYLVVNQKQFTPGYLAQGHFFYAPYNEATAQTVAARSNFILLQIPDRRRVFQSGQLFVVKCDGETFANLD